MEPRIQVNRTELEVLSSFGQLPMNAQDDLIAEVDSNNRESVKFAITKYIVPIVKKGERVRPGFESRLRYSLWYFIHVQPWDPGDVFCRLEPIIDEPEDVLDYYRWAWEAIFSGQEDEMPPADDDNFTVVE